MYKYVSGMHRSILSSIIVIILCCCITNTARAGKVTITSSNTDSSGCKTVNFTVRSETMQRDIKAIAVLPSGYKTEDNKKFPVLYALHGRGAPYDVYSHMSRMKAAINAQPMIVISFSADRASWYHDSTEKKDSQFTTFFFDEFAPAVEANWRISNIRGITGFSMGGYGALHYMTLKPDYFVCVSGLSSAVNALVQEETKYSQPELTELFGENPNKEILDKLQVTKRIAKLVADGVKLPPIYQHIGTEDFLIKENRQFRDQLVQLNNDIRKKFEPQVADIEGWGNKQKAISKLVAGKLLDFTYTESPGGHSWSFWHGAIADVINFHHKAFEKAAAAQAK